MIKINKTIKEIIDMINNKNNMNLIIENENDERFVIFDYNNLGRVRTVTDSFNNKYFCIRDICNVLGIAKHGVSQNA